MRVCVYVGACKWVFGRLSFPVRCCLLPYSTRARRSCHTDDALHSLISFYMSLSECPFRASFLAELGGGVPGMISRCFLGEYYHRVRAHAHTFVGMCTNNTTTSVSVTPFQTHGPAKLLKARSSL